jgi:hypothetical protein
MLYALFLNFALEYAIRKVEANLMGLKLNETHWILIYPDDNLLGKEDMYHNDKHRNLVGCY